MELERRFAQVRREPGDVRSRKQAAAILGQLERAAEPADLGVALMTDDAFVWVAVGLAARARTLVERWQLQRPADRRLRRAAAIYTVAIAPPSAAGRLRAIADDPVAAAAAVANHVFRGELRAAVEACRTRHWFLDHPEAVGGVAYGVWAQAMLDDFDGALAVIATWRHRHPSLAPAQEHALLAAEARVASIRHHHARELALLEEALAICDDAGLGLERTYLEASHAIALVRAGELAAAKRIIERWTAPPPGALQTVDVYRDVARTEHALLAGDRNGAEATAARVLAYAESSGNVIYGCLARFHRVLAATRATRPARLADYARIAAQLQIPLHLRRVRLLQELPHDGTFVVRTRARRVEPIARLFYPEIAEISSDLFWDRVQGTLYLGGDGPFALADHPILRRVLEAVLATSNLEVSIAKLFERVWEMSYDPLRHEGKCHVALHRLRALLAAFHAGSDRLIEVRDGAVRIAHDASVCVFELPRSRKPATRDTLGDRISAHLAAIGEASPAQLEARLGISRTALLQALRALVAERRIERIGRARAVRYRAC